MDDPNSEYISFEEVVNRQREIHARLMAEMDDALKADADRSIVTQLMRAETERDELKAAIKAFLVAFETTLEGEGITIVADFDNYWWPCTYYDKQKPDGMAQRYQTLMALWDAVNPKSE